MRQLSLDGLSSGKRFYGSIDSAENPAGNRTTDQTREAYMEFNRKALT